MAFQPYPRQPAPEFEPAVRALFNKGPDGEVQDTPRWFSEPPAMAPKEAADRYRAMRTQVLRAENALPDGTRSTLLDLEIKRSFGLESEAKAEGQAQARAPMAPRIGLASRRAEAIEPPLKRDPQRRMKGKTAVTRSFGARIPLMYVGAGLAAILAGGALGYGATHYEAISAKADQVASLLKPQPAAAQASETAPASNTMTVVAKKTVATATLKVSDVSGELNSMIPLMLHAEPAVAGHDIVLKLSGLPQSAYLTAGTKAADNAWQLPAVDADGVKLVVPQSSQPSFDVAVAAFETKTGELAAPIKEMRVAIDNAGVQIAPAAAPPESVIIKKPEQAEALPPPKAVPPTVEEQQVAAIEPVAEPPSEANNLLSKGDILLKSGDLGMARRFYEQAFAEGSSEAAIGLGKTYDPVVYAELKVHGLKPDAARAMEWYTRAKSAGNTEAEAAINALKKAAP
jgi:hypothetical protein